ncbi:AbiV family abortive infection protein [Elizabethkingia occulta]|uniref:AbiV family abortive infection protein n=1 Tax=Elizabethkingia occulta TaxID=1867263 RepID=UPI00099A5ACA|nr:AbiV family abortive infection protein [Elizabethkingia occulta]OPB87860.1 hypothetical protein BB020_04580 [Elizabethkingia occulta]
MTKFLNLSPQKSKGIDSKVFNNSRHLYKDALLLSKNNSYPRATSLTILAIEECIKAIYINLHIQGVDIYKTKSASKIFKNHGERHNIAKSIEIILGIIGLINTPSSIALIKDDNFKSLAKAKNILQYPLLILETITRLIKIGNFNDLKNNGLYVDYYNEVSIPDEVICITDFSSVNEIYIRISQCYKFLKLISREEYLVKLNTYGLDSLRKGLIKTINQHINCK